MRTNLNLILGVMAIVALFGLVVAVYGFSALIGPGSHSSGSAQSGAGNGNATQLNPLQTIRLPEKPPTTALGAFSSAAWQDPMRSWAYGKQNLSVVSVSTDSGLSGESSAWKITVYGDDELATFYVEDGLITDVLETSAAGSRAPAVDLAKVLDSDQAWEVASSGLQTDTRTPGTASMTLKAYGDRACWDVTLASGDTLQTVRVDAVSGAIVKSVSVG